MISVCIDSEFMTWTQVMKAQRKIKKLKDPLLTLEVTELGAFRDVKRMVIDALSRRQHFKYPKLSKWGATTIIYDVRVMKEVVDHTKISVAEMQGILAANGFNYGTDAAECALVGWEIAMKQKLGV